MMRQCWKQILSAGFAAFALGAVVSCEVGPNYSRPKMDVPATYKSADSQPSTAPHLATNWWTLYGDPDLTILEEAATENNPSLQAAMARVAQARAASKTVRSAFFPVVTLDPSLTRSRTPASGRNRASTHTDVSIPFDLTYEVDLWGRVRRSFEASQAAVRASADDAAVILQTLQADVAVNYWALRALERQDDIYTQNIELYDKQLSLTNVKLKAGIVGQIDLVQVQTLRATVITQQIDVHRQRQDIEHALAILIGKPPAMFGLEKNSVLPDPPAIPPELPADILRHRPDVAEAEENLIAANSQIGVATANFLPVLHLTGAAGFESIDLQHAVDWESRVWSIGPSLTIPIFEGGRLTAELEQSKVRYDELVATYRVTVLGAFRDVEVALTDLHARNDAVEAQRVAVKSSQENLRLAQIEYEQGVIGYLQVVDADRTLLTNELTLAQLLNDRLASSVLLIKALGGGWQDPAAASQPATTRP